MRKLLLLIVFVVFGFLLYGWLTFPDVGALARENPKTTAFMELRARELRARGLPDGLQQTWVPYAKISPYLRRGVLVAEDDSFYDHDGVDVQGLKVALRKDWEKKQLSHGGSTITQQLAKNLYLSPSRNPLRKVREYLIARQMEKELSKKRILEIYLNVVEFGERVYGAEAASRFYFDRSAASLSAPQAALLAGCLPNPRKMNPGNPDKRLKSRQRMILSRMKRWGYLLEKQVLTEPARRAEATQPAEDVAPDGQAVTITNTSTEVVPPPSDEVPTDTSTETVEETAPPDPVTTTTSEPPPEPATVPPPMAFVGARSSASVTWSARRLACLVNSRFRAQRIPARGLTMHA